MVASHTETPLGVSVWLVRGCPEKYSLPLGRRHGLFVPLTCVALVPYLKARFYLWVSLSPAISRCLKARLYGWLPLSNAYGISSDATQPTSNILRHFFHCNSIPNFSYSSLRNIPSIFISRCNSSPIHRHSFQKKGTILDLTYSALKVHQNTGRGEVKRNPCLECANRLVPKTRQNLCHPAGVLLTVS